MIFNDKDIIPQVTTPKDWLLRHINHRKVNQAIKETNNLAPDVRVIFCCECREIFVMGFVTESEG